MFISFFDMLKLFLEDFWQIKCEHKSPDPDEAGGFLLCSFKYALFTVIFCQTRNNNTINAVTDRRWQRGRVFDRFVCTLLYEGCFGADNNDITGGDHPLVAVATVTEASSRWEQ